VTQYADTISFSYIDGKWVEGVDKKKFDVINPATEEVICQVCEGTEKDVDLAVSAARKAFNTTWGMNVSPNKRSNLMLKLADIAEKNIDLLAAVESLDNGKSISMARGDVGAVVGCLRYYGGWADKIEGKTIDIDPSMMHYTRQEPVRHTILSVSVSRSLLTQSNRLVFADRLSHGTSPFSCSHGRLARLSPPVTP
jgi:acyl-CoA reductase-like NAD-dependent aldehyde dehydrogenase